MSIKYYFQKLLGKLFDTPFIPIGKTVGYSFVKSERSNCTLGKNTEVYPPYYLHKVVLGDYSYIAKNASISNCNIGKFCSIGPSFCCGLGIHPTNGISTAPMFYSKAKQNGTTLCSDNKFEESKETFIGNDVYIGANVTVLDGVNIGDGAIIGAGAVVTKDISPYAIAVGVPAEIKRFRFDEETRKRLLEKQWWNGNTEELTRVADSFWDVESFLNKDK